MFKSEWIGRINANMNLSPNQNVNIHFKNPVSRFFSTRFVWWSCELQFSGNSWEVRSHIDVHLLSNSHQLSNARPSLYFLSRPTLICIMTGRGKGGKGLGKGGAKRHRKVLRDNIQVGLHHNCQVLEYFATSSRFLSLVLSITGDCLPLLYCLVAIINL